MKYVCVGNTYIAHNIDVSALTTANIRFATHILLPFRLRTGPFRRFLCDRERLDEVCLRNKVVVPPQAQLNDLDLNDIIETNRTSDLMTEALVIEGSPPIDADELDAIRHMLIPQSPADRIAEMQEMAAAGKYRPTFSPSDIALRHHPLSPRQRESSSLTVLNSFLVGYERATKDCGGIPPLRRLTSPDLTIYTSVHWVIICQADYRMDDAEIARLLDYAATANLYKKVLSPSQLVDLPEAVLAKIPNTIAEQGHYLFHEFAFEAARQRQTNDLLLAVVYAVLALEGVHAEFLRTVMPEKLDPGLNTNQLIIDLLREQGLFTLFKLTPSLFMHAQERPFASLLERCEKGITVRNDYMHSLHKKGKYKVRSYRESISCKPMRPCARYSTATSVLSTSGQKQRPIRPHPPNSMLDIGLPK